MIIPIRTKVLPFSFLSTGRTRAQRVADGACGVVGGQPSLQTPFHSSFQMVVSQMLHMVRKDRVGAGILLLLDRTD